MYTEEGYLPYYPYHLISDEEMIDAFIFNESNFFDDWYPLPCNELQEQYNTLKEYIQLQCNRFKQEEIAELPDWVYSYMLGEVINIMSEQKDIHDLLVLLNLDNLYDEFNEQIYSSILQVSIKALGIKRTRSADEEDYRPATMFAEPHIIKYLRLDQVSIQA